MDEVEKMYKNAGFIQKRCKDYSCIVCDKNKNCDKYPPFTAEKQLELIKWLIKNHKYFVFVVDVSNFEETLAKFINELAKDNWLTKAEQNEIKNILESEVREWTKTN